MKAVFNYPLVVLISAVFVADLRAQTFSTLRAFTTRSGEAYTNSDGYTPVATLCSSSNVFYGTTLEGGSANSGSVFRIRSDGNGFTNLHSFSALEYPAGPNRDGTGVYTDLVLSGGYLYGIASFGGSFGGGTLFRLKTDGSDFTNLYHFGTPSTTNSAPGAAIILSDNSLYGVTPTGGDFGAGMLFRINLDGSSFTNLHSFSPPSSFQGLRTNADGMYPEDGLTLSGNALCGTATKGGPLGSGTVFRISTNGTLFTVLHVFSGWYNGRDGDGPHGLVLSGNTLYGTTTAGGDFGNGTLFALGTDGSGFTNLHVFTSNFNNNFTNEDGASPNARLILVTHTLYGTTFHAGPSGNGTIFSMSTNGTGFTTVHAFVPGSFDTSGTNSLQPFTNSEGIDPSAGLVLSGDALFGTASLGGSGGGGTVFRVAFPPVLSFTAFGTQAILSWPIGNAGFDYADFTLQSTTNLASPLWVTTAPAPVVVAGRKTVTNVLSGGSQFFRLSR